MNFLSLSSVTAAFLILLSPATSGAEDLFEGKYFRGRGDVEYLRLLDMARRMFEPDPEFQNLSMLYTTNWNGLVEGPTWDAWWIQNSYGTTYAALPFCREPFLTFLQNSQDLWFDQMGDGKRGARRRPSLRWRPTARCATPPGPAGSCISKAMAERRFTIGGMEFTAAGLVLQSELLISRDPQAIFKLPPQTGALRQFHRDPP